MAYYILITDLNLSITRKVFIHAVVSVYEESKYIIRAVIS